MTLFAGFLFQLSDYHTVNIVYLHMKLLTSHFQLLCLHELDTHADFETFPPLLPSKPLFLTSALRMSPTDFRKSQLAIILFLRVIECGRVLTLLREIEKTRLEDVSLRLCVAKHH